MRRRKGDGDGKAEPLSGVLPVVQMPYRADESIDEAVLAREVDWLLAQGIDGAVVLSVGAESTAVAAERARHAEGVGADAVMAIPPVSVGATVDELKRYYERILAATTLPVIVQDASGYVGQSMPIHMQASLVEAFGDRVLYKPEATPIGPKLSALHEATRGQARVFEGTGGITLVDSYRRGIVGTMPGADIAWAIVALWRALEAGWRWGWRPARCT